MTWKETALKETARPSAPVATPPAAKALAEAAPASSVRLNKYLAEQAGISRRAGDRLVKQGRAFVNGKRADSPGLPVSQKDKVTVCNKALPPIRRRGAPLLYFAFNKPAKTLTSMSDPKNRPLVMDFFKKAGGGLSVSGRRLNEARLNGLSVNGPAFGEPHRGGPNLGGPHRGGPTGGGGRLFPVGRLDWDSEGLLLITNDGDFAQKIMHPSGKISKTYLVKINGAFPLKAAVRLKKGIRTPLGEKKALFAAPVQTGRKTPSQKGPGGFGGFSDRGFFRGGKPRRGAPRRGKTGWIKIIIAEGKNRQVRAMLQAAGLPVLRLKRTAVGRLQLGALPKGGRRLLSEKDLIKIFQKPKELCGKKRKKTERFQ